MIFFSLVASPRKPFDKSPTGRDPSGVFMMQFLPTEAMEYARSLGDRCEIHRGITFSLFYFFDESDVLGFKMAMSECATFVQ